MKLFPRKAKQQAPVVDLTERPSMTVAEELAAHQRELEAATAFLRSDAHNDTVVPMSER